MLLVAMNTFTHLIITAPTSDLAAVYKSQLEVVRSKLLCLQGCELFCVADPSGVRIGSGGGTLNALHYLDVIIGRSSLSKAKVAIIHSGGDSKRAPFHTVCGKAWASINALQGDQLLGTPLTMLIEELVMFCKNILSSSCSSGSIVVASSDVMLDICIGEGEYYNERCLDKIHLLSSFWASRFRLSSTDRILNRFLYQISNVFPSTSLSQQMASYQFF